MTHGSLTSILSNIEYTYVKGTEKMNRRITILVFLVGSIIGLGAFIKYYAYEFGISVLLISMLVFMLLIGYSYDYMFETFRTKKNEEET